MNIPLEYPKKLYKYRTFDKEEHYKSLLCNNELFFSSPDQFDDPFDCEAKIEDLDVNDFPQIVQHIEQYIGRPLPRTFVDAASKGFTNTKELDFDTFKKSSNFHGICCLTTKHDNILMWANYADHHHGFCIEYDVEILRDYILQISNSQMREKILGLRKVNYCEKYPIIRNILNMDESNRPALQKHPDWFFEDEWRIIYIRHPNECLRFPEGVITAIYFGINCCSKRVAEIKELLKDKKQQPLFYSFDKSKFEYKLLRKLV